MNRFKSRSIEEVYSDMRKEEYLLQKIEKNSLQLSEEKVNNFSNLFVNTTKDVSVIKTYINKKKYKKNDL